MFASLLIGSLALMVNMVIQIIAVLFTVDYLLRLRASNRMPPGFKTDIFVMGSVLMILFAGHLLQFTVWAGLFVWLGEFADFESAFYHSVVKFTSLGYGDIVMSEKWRLLGALEAANGVLMFGLTASSFLSVMMKLFGRHRDVMLDKYEKSTE